MLGDRTDTAHRARIRGAGRRCDQVRDRRHPGGGDVAKDGIDARAQLDAAHVASPMTGAGFENALLDVAALAAALDGGRAADTSRALDHYERQRLLAVRRLVSSGMAWGRSWLANP